ncbi:flagellar protein FlaG [Marinomonas hwangdonensis]|uniref:Flagellar protein FlaG n=1 Tax=Marinomonas hwangdonensis TaxID=1053647 RepID=A0A3M8QBG8_9GAMM|nr:flagellar protein FlaG [Marinomonas hwangdonensis]RNF52350.1 flagellar protein FlaG [Marinomonas hwangdonensis]
MSINASDFSKYAVNYSSRPEQRAIEDFTAMRQSNAKVVQNLADTTRSNKESTEKKDVQMAQPLAKIEPNDIQEMNQKMSQLNVQLTFEMADDQKQNIVKVLDQSTGDVVRQIPTEEFLKMSERIDAIMNQLSDIKGTLVNSEV